MGAAGALRWAGQGGARGGARAKRGARLTSQERTPRAAPLPLVMLTKFLTNWGSSRKRKGRVDRVTSREVAASQAGGGAPAAGSAAAPASPPAAAAAASLALGEFLPLGPRLWRCAATTAWGRCAEMPSSIRSSAESQTSLRFMPRCGASLRAEKPSESWRGPRPASIQCPAGYQCMCLVRAAAMVDACANLSESLIRVGLAGVGAANWPVVGARSDARSLPKRFEARGVVLDCCQALRSRPLFSSVRLTGVTSVRLRPRHLLRPPCTRAPRRRAARI